MDNSKLIIIVLLGFIAGAVLNTPTLFVGDLFVGGLVVAALAGAIGFFVLRKKA